MGQKMKSTLIGYIISAIVLAIILIAGSLILSGLKEIPNASPEVNSTIEKAQESLGLLSMLDEAIGYIALLVIIIVIVIAAWQWPYNSV